MGDMENHRQNVHYSSESSDFESDDSSDTDEFLRKLHKNVVLPPAKPPVVIKTKGELLMEDLPPVEDLHISAETAELQKTGQILQIFDQPGPNQFVVVVESNDNVNPLDADSVLFLLSGEPLGKIFEIYGTVNKPNYAIRFNNLEDIQSKNLVLGQDVYYLPENLEHTHYVLVDELKQQKGSDASWRDNNEPPADQIEYSDDEEEQLAKLKHRAKNRRNDRNWDSEDEYVVPKKMEKKQATYNQERAFQPRPPSRNRFRSPAPGLSMSLPGSYSTPRSFGSSPSLPGPSGLRRNTPSPRPFRNNSPNGGFRRVMRPSASSSPHNNIPTPPHNNIPTPPPFESFAHSRVPPCAAFSPISIQLHQPFTVPPTSYVTGAPHQSPPSLMAAPRSNVPLQQQILMQPQQPVANFLPQPPPNYSANQNARTFLHQPQSFTPPAFGAFPTAASSLQDTSNRSLVDHNLFLLGPGNRPPSNFSGNLNISQPRNVIPMNSNGHQGPPYGVVQSTAANSFMLPHRNNQHNMQPRVTQPVFVPNQSTFPCPCRSPSYLLPQYQTAPSSLPTQPSVSILSSSHRPVLSNQTQPPTVNPFGLRLPDVRNPMPPPYYPC